MKRLAQTPNEVRLAQPAQRCLAFLRRECHRRRDVLRWLRKLDLRLFDGEQQARKSRLSKSAVRPVSSAARSMKRRRSASRQDQPDPGETRQSLDPLRASRNATFRRVCAERFFQASDTILAAFHVEEPGVAALLKRRFNHGCTDHTDGSRWLFLFSRWFVLVRRSFSAGVSR